MVYHLYEQFLPISTIDAPTLINSYIPSPLSTCLAKVLKSYKCLKHFDWLTLRLWANQRAPNIWGNGLGFPFVYIFTVRDI